MLTPRDYSDEVVAALFAHLKELEKGEFVYDVIEPVYEKDEELS